MLKLPLLGWAQVDPAHEPDWHSVVPAASRRRDPRIWQLASVVSQRCCSHAGVQPHSVLTATALGALDETVRFLEGAFKDGFGSPRNFIASVHNSMAGKLALELKVEGPNLTFCDNVNSLASALDCAALLEADAFPALVVAVDESFELLERLLPHLGSGCRSALHTWADGAVAFMLGKPDEEATPALAAIGPTPCLTTPVPQLCAQLCRELCGSNSVTVPADKGSVDFLAPGRTLLNWLQTPSATPRSVCSHGAGTGCCSIIGLWH